MRCELLPNPQALGASKITVGDVLLYRCVGNTAAEIPSDFVYEKAQLKVIPEDKYKIHLLKAEKKTDQEMQLDLTSYQVGHFEIKEITLTDGEHLISMEPVALTVESVMTEMKPPPQEPFGPMGPMSIEFPYLFLYILLVILGLFVMGLGISLWKKMKWRKVLEGLKEHDAAQTPANQFYQNLRRLQRSNLEKSQVAIQELYSFWKLFLLRKYRIPAYDWTSKNILKYIKSKDRILYKKLENDLWQIFHEFDRALKDIDQTSKKDLSLLMDHSRHLVDQMQTRNEGRT